MTFTGCFNAHNLALPARIELATSVLETPAAATELREQKCCEWLYTLIDTSQPDSLIQVEKYFEAIERLKTIQKSTQRMRLMLYRLRPIIHRCGILVRADYQSLNFTFRERAHVDELAAAIPVKVEMHFRGSGNQLHQSTALTDDIDVNFYVTVIRDVTIEECTVKYSKRQSLSGWKDAMLMLADCHLSTFSYVAGSERKKDLKAILYLKARKEPMYEKRYRFISDVRSNEKI